MKQKNKRPNIIYIFSDQQRADTMGCYGQSLPVTPHLDSMAKEGVVFSNAFSVQPLCGPARSCMQTGQYATNSGCHVNGLPLKESSENIASIFSREGYRTGYVGKWHLAGDPARNEHFLDKPIPENMRGGYKDRWVVSNLPEMTSTGYGGYLFDDDRKIFFSKYRADALTDYALDFIEDFSGEPFFLTVSYLEPHQQNSTDTHECPAGTENQFSNFKSPPDLLPGKGNWEKEFSRYLACCNNVDSNVGRIIERLKKEGIYEDTIILYSSDHGSHFRTRPGTYKRSCHEGSIKVPLIIRGREFNTGKKIKGLASILDIPVTLLSAAGIKPPEKMQGKNLSLFADDEDACIREDIFVQISEVELGRSVRTGRYKLHVSSPDPSMAFTPSTDRYKYVYLYDLETDPGEHENLINDPRYADILEDLTQRIKANIMEVEKINAVIDF